MAAATSQTSKNQALMSSPKDKKASTATQVDQVKSEGQTEDTKSTANAPATKTENPDYFTEGHGTTHFSLEPNPFEQSFGNPSTETPSKFGGLPSVASLTSPAPIGAGNTPGWSNSLRSGPLSPAMLPGPTGSNGDYFDSSFRQSFPTPNESSLRSGLTPGGGGSMFPAPSPNSQAIYNSMQSGGATPGTLDFHRTAMSAAARSKSDQNTNANTAINAMISKEGYQPAQQQQTGAQNPFNNNSEHDAVNSLYMLANNGQRNANQFALPNQPQGMGAGAAQMAPRMGSSAQDTTPANPRKHQQNASGAGMSENGEYGSDASADQKSSSKKGKKGGAKGAANGRRKAEDTPGKGGSAAKKAKAMESPQDFDDDDDDLDSPKGDETMSSSGKKLTDEEKRKNFLERNRVAALKCRQRKKQWLSNLQTKVELFSTENEALSSQNASLQEEIRSLKTILMAHKDCPVSHSQGLGGAQMANVLGADFDHPNNSHYGMGMSNNNHMMMQHQGQGMQRT